MFRLTIKPSVKKDTKNINKNDLQRIVNDINALKIDPFPPRAKKIKGGKEPYYRIRQGSYRIGYKVNMHKKLIDVIFVKRRTESTY